MTQVSRTKLRTALNDLFNIGELRELCLDLGIEYGDLGSGGKNEKVLSLIRYAERHNLYQQVVAYVQKARPHANLGAAAASAAATNQAAPAEQPPAQPPDPQSGSVFHIHGNVIGTVGGGQFQAHNVAGGDIILGGQPIPQTRDEFDKLLTELKELLAQAVQAGEIENERDAEAAVEDLQDAEAEAEAEEPRSSRLKRYLENVAETLEGSAQVATAAGKVGQAVIKAAPIAAALVKLAQVVF